ncbi:hypothetical protein [Pseudomonas juntendi]|uniref:Uncharacterized protein n=1 Tax=Pseudomonas juntendi TaxID=2666183 RepID=A0AAJ5RXZ1_9PSED|nr:hypothetical protein [Pseudomonas juntendi]WEA19042.1 hypothetical protein PWA60_17295 [Pseudomonas juntendi]
MIMNRDQAVEVVSSFGSPGDAACCAIIFDYVQSGSKRLYHYSDFVEAVAGLNLPDSIQNVQRCLNVLKSKRFGLLRQEYRYLDDDGVVYPVDVEDIQAAYTDGALCLEWRNFPDPDFASKIYIVFLPVEGSI